MLCNFVIHATVAEKNRAVLETLFWVNYCLKSLEFPYGAIKIVKVSLYVWRLLTIEELAVRQFAGVV